jgi:hypothetical protein
MRVSVQLLLICLLLVSGAARPIEIGDAPERVVAIGDIHADIDAARQAFRLAGAVDEDDNWIGGDLVVVQLGDLIGRSYQDLEVLNYVLGLKEKARAGGGQVHALIGNHEVFAAKLYYRWVPEEAFTSFQLVPHLVVDDPRLVELPEHQRARAAALMPGGFLAKQLAEFPVILRLGDTIFVHGGVMPFWARYGIDRINNDISRWLAGEIDEPVAAKGMSPGTDYESVVTSRHFSKNVDERSCEMLEKSLQRLQARRMVVAHSVQDSITSYCDEKVWAVDVGMSRYYGGDIEVLEIVDDEVVSVLRD